MNMNTSVKFFHSAMAGAPSLTGQVGSLIAVLDACLVDGFALKPVDSLVVANNVATMTIGTGHSFEVGSVALNSGAAPAALNGEHRVTAVTTNSVSFATTGLSDQTATGSITTKLAAAGWGKPFSGTNLAVYRSADVTGNRNFLRVNDNYTTDPREARLTGYEAMTAVSAGTGLFPTVAQVGGGAFLAKSTTADAVARPWVFFADEKFFYLAVRYHPSYGSQTYFFGEPIGFKTPDPYNTVLGASSTSVINQGYFHGSIDRMGNGTNAATFTNGDNIVPRAPNGLGSARSVGRTTVGGINTTESGTHSYVQYPNPADNALVFADILMLSDQSLRARFPGVYWVPQQLGGAFTTLDTVVGSGMFAGKTFVAIASSSNASTGGAYFVDRDGPWR
jgi:hypothetical protein